MRHNRGFTLIELLLVIAIIATMAVVVWVGLRPSLRFAQSRDSVRWNDVNSILVAVHQYTIDNDGALPSGITTTPMQLGTCLTGGTTNCPDASSACLDLSTPLAAYLKTIPIDPQGTAATTGYQVSKDSFNFVTVKACKAEDPPILVTR